MNGTSPVACSLTVTTGFDPTVNSGFPSTDAYSILLGTIVTTPTTGMINCYPTTGSFRITSGGGSDSIIENHHVDVYEYGLIHRIDSGIRITARSDSSADYAPEMNWITQMSIYQAIQEDSTLADSSVLLQHFAYLAQHSRYARLTEAENYLSTGHLDSVTNILSTLGSYTNTATDSLTGFTMADGAGANDVVTNYVNYFNVLMKYMQDTLNADDRTMVSTLAGLCPDRNGTVIFEARALYSMVFGSVPENTNNCGTDTATSRITKYNKNTDAADDPRQSYQLYPNPNNGNFVLRQATFVVQTVDIVVYNTLGAVVYKGIITFSSGYASLKLDNQVPGLYLLLMKDNTGKQFNLKFVIE